MLLGRDWIPFARTWGEDAGSGWMGVCRIVIPQGKCSGKALPDVRFIPD